MDAQLLIPIYIILGAVAAMLYSLKRVLELERRILSMEKTILSFDKKLSQALMKKR